ncbi:MAG TPA: sensor histidine kinase, partial [Terriglobia bacterium]|nr:sensor histidine kinase [Terriglobia bacterium]
QRIAAFVRTITKAPDVETVISEAFQNLKQLARVDRARIVYSPAPGRWTEWKAGTRTAEVRQHEEWPAPAKSDRTVFFEAENSPSGYFSAGGRNPKLKAMLEIVAPQVWSAVLLQLALARVQSATISETELVRATLRARDEERRHIARELHDDLGQSLASLRLALKWTEDRVRKHSDMGQSVIELESARQDVGAMLDKIRDLSHTLYPRILDTLGLVSAIKELAHHTSQHSAIAIECHSEGKSRAIAREIEVALYRCCQEAISNAIRHADASSIEVVVYFEPGELRVTVEDDGKGFDPRKLYDSNSRIMSSGFWTIRQRMADLGAAFRVSTSKGHGTVVEMIVPLSSRKIHDRSKNKNTDRR